MPNPFVAALAAFPDQLEALFARVPAAYRGFAPSSWEGIPSESFTPIEQLCHVRDIEIDGYQVRIRRMLDEASPTLISLDGYVLARERGYQNDQPALVLAAFRAARGQTVAMVEPLSEVDFRRSGVFEGYGPLTVTGLLELLCSHDQQHLAGLHWLLARIDSQEMFASARA